MINLLRILTRNPLTEYLRYVADLMILSGRYDNFHQGYLSKVRNSEIGSHVVLGHRSFIGDSTIGDYTYIHSDSVVWRADIGRFCSMAQGCRVGLGMHPSRNFVSTHPAFFNPRSLPYSFVDQQSFESYGRITIGNDVWIGTNVLIADGVSIGNGAIIGAGAVVVKSVPAYAIYGGVPARLIRYRFTPSEVSWLNEFRWWDKSEQWLREHAEAFRNIQSFMSAADYMSADTSDESSIGQDIDRGETLKGDAESVSARNNPHD